MFVLIAVRLSPRGDGDGCDLVVSIGRDAVLVELLVETCLDLVLSESVFRLGISGVVEGCGGFGGCGGLSCVVDIGVGLPWSVDIGVTILVAVDVVVEWWSGIFASSSSIGTGAAGGGRSTGGMGSPGSPPKYGISTPILRTGSTSSALMPKKRTQQQFNQSSPNSSLRFKSVNAEQDMLRYSCGQLHGHQIMMLFSVPNNPFVYATPLPIRPPIHLGIWKTSCATRSTAYNK